MKADAQELAKEISILELKLFGLKRKLHAFNQLDCLHINEIRTYEPNEVRIHCTDCGFWQNIKRPT
jgi:hypothetical protein